MVRAHGGLFRKRIRSDGAYVDLYWHPCGLPIEDFWEREIGSFRQIPGNKLGQLAMFEAEGRPNAQRLWDLFRQTWELILRLGLTHVFLMCHPGDVWVYKTILEFGSLSWPEVTPYATGQNKAVAMVLDVKTAQKSAKPRLRRHFES